MPRHEAGIRPRGAVLHHLHISVTNIRVSYAASLQFPRDVTVTLPRKTSAHALA